MGRDVIEDETLLFNTDNFTKNPYFMLDDTIYVGGGVSSSIGDLTFVGNALKTEDLNIKYVVAHASKGDNPPLLNSTQLDKFEKMMNKFDNQPAILCLENVRNCTNLFSILRLRLKNVAVCFDVGHAHCYADEKQLFEQCKPYVICSHIHNNFGQDTHQSPKDGEIDLAYFAKQLTEIKNCSNCLECFPPRGSNFSKEEFASFVKLLYDETNEILSN